MTARIWMILLKCDIVLILVKVTIELLDLIIEVFSELFASNLLCAAVNDKAT